MRRRREVPLQAGSQARAMQFIRLRQRSRCHRLRIQARKNFYLFRSGLRWVSFVRFTRAEMTTKSHTACRGAFYRNVVKISRTITARQSQQTFGFDLGFVSLPHDCTTKRRTNDFGMIGTTSGNGTLSPSKPRPHSPTPFPKSTVPTLPSHASFPAQSIKIPTSV